jgi:hypothetical protein
MPELVSGQGSQDVSDLELKDSEDVGPVADEIVAAQTVEEVVAWKAGCKMTDKTLMCKFWLKGRCLRNECIFAHSENEQRAACARIVCRFDAAGTCRQGKECWYRHTDANLSKLQESLESEDECSKSLEDACKGEPAAKTADFEDENLRAEALSDQEEEEDSVAWKDTRRPCKFWIKGCCRAANCRFAHSRESQPANGSSPKRTIQANCRFYMVGRCTKGSRCLFKHPAGQEGSKSLSPPASVATTSAGSPSITCQQPNWADLSDSDDDFMVEQGVASMPNCLEVSSQAESLAPTSASASSVGELQRAECWRDLTSDSEVECSELKADVADTKAVGKHLEFTSQSRRHRIRLGSWADLSESDDDFSPRAHAYQGYKLIESERSKSLNQQHLAMLGC